jgi:hypothetical protein
MSSVFCHVALIFLLGEQFVIIILIILILFIYISVMDELFIKPTIQLYNVQGGIEHFSSPQFVYKSKSQPKDCVDCPKGSYGFTCNMCKVHEFAFNPDQPSISMLECKCKKNKYDTDPWVSVVKLENASCSNDIANCNGKLKCGTCFNTSFYSFDGNLTY